MMNKSPSAVTYSLYSTAPRTSLHTNTVLIEFDLLLVIIHLQYEPSYLIFKCIFKDIKRTNE